MHFKVETANGETLLAILLAPQLLKTLRVFS
jgi:hypothetical protein